MAEWAGDWNLWGWVIAGLVLLCAELLLPGIFLVWFGAAALATACLLLLAGGLFGFSAQLAAFLIFSVLFVWLSRSYFAARQKTDAPFLNSGVQELIGQVFTLEEPIQDGKGRLLVNDTIWRLRGANAPKGARIRITAYCGGALTAEPAG